MDLNQKMPVAYEGSYSNQRPPAERGSGPFEGPSSYPQLCWWSLILSFLLTFERKPSAEGGAMLEMDCHRLSRRTAIAEPEGATK
jgi:hypothetical protein